MVTLTAETNAILKLDLGDEGGIRRIPLAKLWDPVTSRVSYQRLSNMALEYRDIADLKVERVSVTYTDEDGDNITISTDDELADAFEQFATRVPPIVRAKASFQVEKNGKKIVKGLKQAVSEIGDTVKNGDGPNQMQDVLDSFMTILTQAVDSFSKNLDGTQQQKRKVASRTFPSEVRARYRSHKACCSAIKKRGITRNLRNKVIDEISSKAKADPAQVRARNRKHKACCSEIERREIARNIQKKVIRTEGIDGVSSKTKTDAVRNEDDKLKDLYVFSKFKDAYLIAKDNKEKQIIVDDLIAKVENLRKDSSTGVWNAVGYEKACENLSQALRERTTYEANKDEAKADREVSDESLPSDIVDRRSATKTDTVRKEDEEPKNLNVSTEVEKKQEIPSDTLPVAKDSGESFIHGRHTCDGCGVTPIIGLRFHAINLPDYDLCDKCAQKNRRKDIIFEPTERESDRYLQNKWKRQQSRLMNNVMRGGCGGEIISGNSAPFCRVDNALAEAISRSLEDVQPKIEEKKELKNEQTISKEDEESVQCQITKEKCSDVLKYNDGEDISYSVTTHESYDSDISDGEQDGDDSAPFSSGDDALAEAFRRSLQVAQPETEEKEELKNEKTVSKRYDEIVDVESPKLAEINDDKEVALMDEKDEEKVDFFCKEEKVEEEISEAKSNLESNTYHEEASETIESKLNGRVDEQTSPSLLKVEKKLTVHITPNLFCLDCSSSDSSDDTENIEGQGNVSFAKDNDLHVSANVNDKDVCEIVQSVDYTNEHNTVGSENTTNNNDESEESSHSQSSVDSWQILDENERVSSDEMIAQAAQLLGSALFQSDTISDVTVIKDERTITTDYNSISETSSETSAPTIVSRTISPFVLSRWDKELKELHEVGFLDDEKNVNALEHLEAANIGVDSDDPVTVNGAVNYLLSKYNEII